MAILQFGRKAAVQVFLLSLFVFLPVRALSAQSSMLLISEVLKARAVREALNAALAVA